MKLSIFLLYFCKLKKIMNKETFSLLIILLSISSGFTQSFNWVNDPEKGYSVPVGTGNYDELSKGEFYSEMEEY